MLHIYIYTHTQINKARSEHVLYLLCQRVSMLNVCSLTHTHTNTHILWAAVCLFCSFSALTQLQFAVRQDSQGWSKKCQHILHLTFLLLGFATETLGLYPQLEFRTRQTVKLLGNLSAARFPPHGKRGHFTYICNLFVSAQVLCSCRTFGVHCGSAACKSWAMATVALPVMWLFSSDDLRLLLTFFSQEDLKIRYVIFPQYKYLTLPFLQYLHNGYNLGGKNITHLKRHLTLYDTDRKLFDWARNVFCLKTKSKIAAKTNAAFG